MSIASEITRLQGAKADLRTAIQAKGVSVPASAKLDTYDTYVGQIQQGSTPRLQSKTATPSISQQTIIPDNGYDGLSQVTIGAVTSSIDSNIQAGNIKQGVTILGVAGSYAGGGSTLVPTAGDYPVVLDDGMKRIAATSYTATGVKITIPVTGTYRLKWCAFRNTTSGTSGTRCYRNGTAIGTAQTTFQESYWQSCTLDIALTAGDEIELYARSRATNYYCCAGMLSACVAQKLWTN